MNFFSQTRNTRLTIVITGGGSAKSIIIPASHLFLSDRAYARRAENADKRLTSIYDHGENFDIPLNAMVPSIVKVTCVHPTAVQLMRDDDYKYLIRLGGVHNRSPLRGL